MIDHDLADYAHALDVGAWHEDVAVLIADVVERPPHPLAAHQRFADRLSLPTGRCRSTQFCALTICSVLHVWQRYLGQETPRRGCFPETVFASPDLLEQSDNPIGGFIA